MPVDLDLTLARRVVADVCAAHHVTLVPPDHLDALYRGALVTVCASRYVEPFGGVAVESMLCGTPVLASPFGAYTETIQQGVSGWRCHTLGDYLAAIELAENQWLWRGCVHGCAKARYDMREIGARYEEVIEQLTDLRGAGWFSPRSPLRPSTERSGA